MATVTKVERSGRVRWRAFVRKQDGENKVRKSQYFETKKQAQAWGVAYESKLENPLEFKKALKSQNNATLSFLIDWYIKTYKDRAGWQRTKQAHLVMLKTFEIAEKPVEHLSNTEYIEHISTRLHSCKAATANNDMVWIRVVLKSALAHFPDLPINLQELDNASEYMRQNKMIGKGARRERRPTADELKRLDEYFKVKDQGSTIPMRDIMWFAVNTARRQAEITRICWSGYDADRGVCFIQDVKHPTQKIGNDKTFRLTKKAQEIIARQAKMEEEIFPYNARTVSANFTRACKLLEIINLKFHDLRHEGTSRLFEQGYSIVEVQQFTLHESWAMLKRYTNLRPEDVKLKEKDELSDVRLLQAIKEGLHIPNLDLEPVVTLAELRKALIAALGGEIAADSIINGFSKEGG